MTPIPDIEFRPLSYTARLEPRSGDAIDMLVIHCTELPDLATAREYGERVRYPETRTGNSGHFYIDRDGRIEEWVEPLRVAHHARGHNGNSIGIELVNEGRYPDWYDSRRQDLREPYGDLQLSALINLVRHLGEQFPTIRYIAGHEDLDRSLVSATDSPGTTVRRKMDPGPRFPWRALLQAVELRRFKTIE